MCLAWVLACVFGILFLTCEVSEIVTSGMFVCADEFLCVTHVVTMCERHSAAVLVSFACWPTQVAACVWTSDRLPNRKPMFQTGKHRDVTMWCPKYVTRGR